MSERSSGGNGATAKRRKYTKKEEEKKRKNANIKHPRTEFVSDRLVGFFIEQTAQISDRVLVHGQPLHKVLRKKNKIKKKKKQWVILNMVGAVLRRQQIRSSKYSSMIINSELHDTQQLQKQGKTNLPGCTHRRADAGCGAPHPQEESAHWWSAWWLYWKVGGRRMENQERIKQN